MRSKSVLLTQIERVNLSGSENIQVSNAEQPIPREQRTSSNLPLPPSLTLNGNEVSRLDLGSLRSRKA